MQYKYQYQLFYVNELWSKSINVKMKNVLTEAYLQIAILFKNNFIEESVYSLISLSNLADWKVANWAALECSELLNFELTDFSLLVKNC